MVSVFFVSRLFPPAGNFIVLSFIFFAFSFMFLPSIYRYGMEL